jgi:hypothetical protein
MDDQSVQSMVLVKFYLDSWRSRLERIATKLSSIFSFFRCFFAKISGLIEVIDIYLERILLRIHPENTRILT